MTQIFNLHPIRALTRTLRPPPERVRIWFWIGVLLLSRLLAPAPVRAHAGAPYPVLIDEPFGPYRASALADPDTGTGTFWIELRLADGTAVPPDTVVTLGAAPQDGHRPESITPAVKELNRSGEEQFVARIPFDSTGPWNIRMAAAGTAGDGEHTFSVQVTPPYPGGLMTLLCLLPFIALGAIWWWGARRPHKE